MKNKRDGHGRFPASFPGFSFDPENEVERYPRKPLFVFTARDVAILIALLICNI